MISENRLRKVNIFLAIAIMIAPLVAHYAYIFPYIYLKNIYFRLLVLLGAFFMIWYSLYKDKINIKKHWVFLAFLLFLLVQTLATFLGVNPINSLLGNYERMDGLIHLFSLGIYFLLLINTFRNTKDWLWIFRVSIMTSVAVVAYDFLGDRGVIGDFPIPSDSATIGNTLFFGSYLMFNVFFSVIAMYIDKFKSWRIFYLAAILLDIIYIFINASRSSMIGLVVGFGLLMLFMFFKVNKKIKILFLAIVLAFLSFVGVVVAQRDSAWVQNVYFLQRLTNISRDDFSTLNRLLIWEVGLEALQDRPILGYGPENTVFAVDKYYNAEISEQWFDRVHNFVIDHLLNAGIVGLLSFLTIFVAAFISAWKYLKQHYFLAAALISTLVAYLIHNLFTFDTLVTWLPLIVLLAFTDFLSGQNKTAKSIEWPLILRKGKNIILLLFVVLFGAYAYFMLAIPTYANKMGIQASIYSRTDVDKSLAKFKEAFDYHTYGDEEITLALADVTRIKMGAEKLDVEVVKKYTAEMERQINYLLEQYPANVRMRMVLADMYLGFAQYDKTYTNKAIKVLEPVFEYSPNRLEAYAMMTQAYIYNGNIGTALDYMQQSLSKNGSRQEDYLNIMYVYYNMADLENFDHYATEYIEKFDGEIDIQDYNAIARYYVNMGAGKRLLDSGIIEKIININPEPGNYLLYLDAYNNADMDQEALAFIESINQQDPNLGEDLLRYWGLIQD